MVVPATNTITAKYKNLNNIGIGSLKQRYTTGAQISNVKAAKNAMNIGSPKSAKRPESRCNLSDGANHLPYSG
ncbi:hypothetical protein IB024_01735 [Brucella sp. 6810]|nr:hypothetical protein IB024_01735 [Brucella sp. 6810]